MRNMTQEKLEIEKKLLQTQKWESLGVLAGGFAHDFSNLLMAILGNLDLALLDISPASPPYKSIQRAYKAGRKAADLTRQMLIYSGKGDFLLENIKLNLLLEEMKEFLKVSINKNASLEMILEDIPPVWGDTGQMQQLILNLAMNAAESIDETGGEVIIKTCIREYTEEELNKSFIQEKPAYGKLVCLEIADTGCGISEKDMKNIFDPFFTTKMIGRGLGLPAVLSIVRSHKGALLLESKPNKGTKIQVLFPVSREITQSLSILDADNSIKNVENTDLSSSKKVLLVDDEEIIRETCKELLMRLGFQVLLAQDGEEAISVFEQHKDEIVYIFMDWTMPKMDGLSAFRELQKKYPKVKVVLCSGYSKQDIASKHNLEGISGFLQKPYDLKKLLDIKKILEKVF